MTPLAPLLALAQKDLRTYRLAFPAAFAAGLLALAVPWIPGIDAGLNAAEVRLTSAIAVGFLGACILALLHGISGFPRETAERRLGFFLARPVGLTTLYAGRLLGGLLASLGVAFLVLLPTLLSLLFQAPGSGKDVASLPLTLVVLSLGLMALGHAASQALLARSPWLLLDVLVLAGTGLATLYCQFLLTAYLGSVNPGGLAASVAGAYAVAALAGGLAALRGGRTDLRRGHRLLSLTMAGFMAAAALGLGLYTRARIAWDPAASSVVTPSSLPGQGEWVGLSHGREGSFGDFDHADFLHHLPTGRSLRLPLQNQVSSYRSEILAFDAQGRRAAWLQPVPSFTSSRRSRIQVADLQGATAQVRTLGSGDGLDLERMEGFQFSPDGTLLALLTSDRLRVFDARHGVVVLDRALSGSPNRDMFFLSGERIRLVQTDPGTPSSEIREFQIVGGRETVTGHMERSGRGTWVTAWHPGTDRLLMWDRRERGLRSLHLREGRTGRTVAVVGEDSERSRMYATSTADGGIVLAEDKPEGFQVRLLDPEGKHLRTIQLAIEGPETLWRIVGFDALGRLILHVGHPRSETCALLGVDLGTGALAYRVPGLQPTTPPWHRAVRLKGTGHTPGSLMTQFYRNPQGDLLVGDPGGPMRLIHKRRRPQVTPGS